jgi:hypothetical protein
MKVSDIVSVHLRAVPKFHYLLNRQWLNSMKRGGVKKHRSVIIITKSWLIVVVKVEFQQLRWNYKVFNVKGCVLIHHKRVDLENERKNNGDFHKI